MLHTANILAFTHVLNASDILPSITGLHDVYLKFVSQPGKYVGNVDYIKFTENLEPAAALVTANIDAQPGAQAVAERNSAIFRVTASAADNSTI